MGSSAERLDTFARLSYVPLIGDGSSREQAVYRKLGVSTRTEALHRAYQVGLLESPLLEAAVSG